MSKKIYVDPAGLTAVAKGRATELVATNMPYQQYQQELVARDDLTVINTISQKQSGTDQEVLVFVIKPMEDIITQR